MTLEQASDLALGKTDALSHTEKHRTMGKV